MATAKRVQLSDVPYTEDRGTYEYLTSVNAALASLQQQVNALNERVDKEGVITGKSGNAWYVKLPDGALIQGSQNLIHADELGTNIYWPIEFIGTEYTVISDVTGNGAGNVVSSWVWTRSKGSAHVGVRELGNGGPTSTCVVMCVAIGRWK
jgi:hypothetical protein